MKEEILALLREWLIAQHYSPGAGTPYVGDDFWPDAVLDGDFDMEKLAEFLAERLTQTNAAGEAR